MPIGHKGAAFRQLQTIFNAGTVAGLSDSQLLERFADRGDSLAFEALVVRHGSLVLGVCRNVLRNDHAAEDAFQATFLVLARRAGAIRKPGSLAPWLHGVAFRISARARVDSLRQRSIERRAVESAQPDSSEGLDLDSRAAIHEEVHRLPERYRAAVVLCYFEGLTHDQAAVRLGWPVGTVRGRLARARDLLRGRLTRRGLAPTAGLLGAALSRSSASAAVSTNLETTTIKAAIRIAAGESVTAGACSATVATLTRGALRTMMLTKLKLTGAALLIAGFATAGAGVVAQQAEEKDAELLFSAEPSESNSRPSTPASRKKEPAQNARRPVAKPQNDDRLTKIEEALQAIKKQSEALHAEMRKVNPSPDDKILSSDQLHQGIQEVQGVRAELAAQINEELELAKAQVEKLRVQLSKAEQFVSDLQRLHDDVSGNRSLRPSVAPVIPAPTLPVPQPARPTVIPQPIQPKPLAPEPGTDQNRDRRLDRLEQMMQRLLEQRGATESSLSRD